LVYANRTAVLYPQCGQIRQGSVVRWLAIKPPPGLGHRAPPSARAGAVVAPAPVAVGSYR